MTPHTPTDLMTGPRRAARTGSLTALVALLVAVLAVVSPAGAVAVDPPPPTLTLTAPAQGKAGLPATFTGTLLDGAGTPLAGATVSLQRLGSAWVSVASGTTDAAGRVTFQAALPTGASSWRASWAGDATHVAVTSTVAQVTGVRLASSLVLTGVLRLVDERRTTLKLLWVASDGTPISNGVVTVYRRLLNGAFTAYARLRTSSTGRASLLVAPRVDSTWRAIGTGASWWLSDTSPDKRIDNVPPISPVSYPSAAPRPAYTAPQPRAVGAGANPVVTALPNGVWSSMVGRSWHSGCPLGRSGLRLLRVNYWGFDGYRYRGEMVLATAAAGRAGAALRDMYNGHYPIRRMYRVDRFGWSSRLHGADDYESMRSDNTSGFNCRSVVNRPGVLSPHARGRAVDLNTWENPYRSATGLVPNSWWASRSHPKIAWRSSSHPVVRIWRAHGFRWTYGTGDSQHVDGRTMVVLSGGFSG